MQVKPWAAQHRVSVVVAGVTQTRVVCACCEPLSEPQLGAHRRGGRRHHVRHRLSRRLDSRHVAALSGNNSRSKCPSTSLPANLRRLAGRHSQALERPLLVLGLRLGQAVRVDARLGRRKGGRSCSCWGSGNSGWRRRRGRARPLGGRGRDWCRAAGRARGRVTGFFALRGGGDPWHAHPALRLHVLCVRRRPRQKCVSPLAQHRSQSAAHSKGVPSVCLARNQASLFQLLGHRHGTPRDATRAQPVSTHTRGPWRQKHTAQDTPATCRRARRPLRRTARRPPPPGAPRLAAAPSPPPLPPPPCPTPCC